MNNSSTENESETSSSCSITDNNLHQISEKKTE